MMFAKFSRISPREKAPALALLVLFVFCGCLCPALVLADNNEIVHAVCFHPSDRGPLTIQSTDLALASPPLVQKNLKIKVTWPAEKGVYPLLLWSHGMTATPDVYPALIDHWVSHGYSVMAVRHRDSREIPQKDRAVSFENWQERPKEVSFILDQLSVIEKAIPDLSGKIDQHHIAAGGYSFGGQTALLLAGAGQKDGIHLRDDQVQAVIAISPAGPRDFFHPSSYTTIATPMLVTAGTRDTAKYPDQFLGRGWRWHTSPYYFSRRGDQYLAVATLACHDYRGIEATAPDQESLYVEALQRLTLDFLNLYLKAAQNARADLRPLRVFGETCGIIRFFRR